MTKITFFKKEKTFIGFEVKGHTGKDEYGKDLLCCQISTVAQLAVLGINDVLKTKAFVEISDGYLVIKLGLKEAQEEKIKFLMETCYQSFKSIIQDEQKFVKMEVKNDF